MKYHICNCRLNVAYFYLVTDFKLNIFIAKQWKFIFYLFELFFTYTWTNKQ